MELALQAVMSVQVDMDEQTLLCQYWASLYHLILSHFKSIVSHIVFLLRIIIKLQLVNSLPGIFITLGFHVHVKFYGCSKNWSSWMTRGDKWKWWWNMKPRLESLSSSFSRSSLLPNSSRFLRVLIYCHCRSIDVEKLDLCSLLFSCLWSTGQNDSKIDKLTKIDGFCRCF